jgi:hypothetical protein
MGVGDYGLQLVFVVTCVFVIGILPGRASEAVFNSAFGTEVLPASKFSGRAARSYGLAKEIPEVCCKLFCYCGCDYSDDHTSLLDCFTTIHGEACPICQEEVIDAYHLKKSSKTISEIQDAIDSHFGSQYPFKVPSPAYEKYRKSIGLASLKSVESSQHSGTDPSNPGMPEIKDDLAKQYKLHRPGNCCQKQFKEE